MEDDIEIPDFGGNSLNEFEDVSDYDEEDDKVVEDVIDEKDIINVEVEEGDEPIMKDRYVKITTVKKKKENPKSDFKLLDYKNYLKMTTKGFPSQFYDAKIKIAEELLNVDMLVSEEQLCVMTDLIFNSLFYGFPINSSHKEMFGMLLEKSSFLQDLYA